MLTATWYHPISNYFIATYQMREKERERGRHGHTHGHTGSTNTVEERNYDGMGRWGTLTTPGPTSELLAEGLQGFSYFFFLSAE